MALHEKQLSFKNEGVIFRNNVNGHNRPEE